jgi:hypothetical protein
MKMIMEKRAIKTTQDRKKRKTRRVKKKMRLNREEEGEALWHNPQILF